MLLSVSYSKRSWLTHSPLQISWTARERTPVSENCFGIIGEGCHLGVPCVHSVGWQRIAGPGRRTGEQQTGGESEWGWEKTSLCRQQPRAIKAYRTLGHIADSVPRGATEITDTQQKRCRHSTPVVTWSVKPAADGREGHGLDALAFAVLSGDGSAFVHTWYSCWPWSRWWLPQLLQ